MNDIDIAAVLQRIRPGATWTLFGNSFEGLQWDDPEQPAPTPEEIEDEWPGVAAAIEKDARDQQRRDAYATEADPLFFKWQRGEATEQEWADKVAEIRLRYPS